MYDDVLIPVDGSEGAAEALHHAAEIAHRTDATIHLLSVADTSRDSVTVVGTEVVDALVEDAERIVADAGDTLQSLDVPYESDVVRGHPAPTIVEYAEEHDHDLIVMPTHGRRGIARYLLGSITEKVVRTSPVPVLTLRMREDEQLTFPYERILIATDGSDASTRAGTLGIALASTLDATVHVLSVVERRSPEAKGNGEQDATDAVDALVEEAERAGIDEIVRHVERGDPSDLIRETVSSQDVHAVVMGTTGRSGANRILLGSVAERTARSAPVPVMTVGSDTS